MYLIPNFIKQQFHFFSSGLREGDGPRVRACVEHSAIIKGIECKAGWLARKAGFWEEKKLVLGWGEGRRTGYWRAYCFGARREGVRDGSDGAQVGVLGDAGAHLW